jgi:NTP pyrophosphatase (non-canonical NTP hydrolase)
MNPLERLTLASIQGMNESIYGAQNRRHFGEPWRILCRINIRLSMAHKAVRRNNTTILPYHLCMGLSWTLALANNLKIGLEDEVWKKYPGRCPHCTGNPCRCPARAETRSVGVSPTAERRPTTFREFQNMFAQIYPNNNSLDSAGHALEEVGEVAQALDHWLGRREPDMFDRVISELVDVIAHICAIAICNKIDLTTEMAKLFADGCNRCHLPECDCGFTTDIVATVRDG